MTESFDSHSMLDDDKHVQITLGKTGVIFRIGKVDSAIIHHENIVVDYDLSEQLLWKALVAIKERKNG